MRTYFKDYPRPQLVRSHWTNLNGEWDFMFDDSLSGEKEGWQHCFPQESLKIQVPFTYETPISGIGDSSHHENVWYRRTIEIKAPQLEGKRIRLHFEGSDFSTLVWINGIYVGEHLGGYARFSFDITDQLTVGDNAITVKVEDSKSIAQPRGKQRWIEENFGCWYIQTTGIWKTVWMESVDTVHVSALKLTPDIEAGKIHLIYDFELGTLSENIWVETMVLYEEKLINCSKKLIRQNREEDSLSVCQREENPWGIHLWSPENPALYDLKIRIIQDGNVLDEVSSYFGMRQIQISKGNILLNGTPLYQRLILDQGYWEDSHLTPPSEDALVEDIEKIQALGYNGLRKHMKIEDKRFLYWCDVKGLLVWSEMAATYDFHDGAVEEFTREWMEIVKQNYNHPSIIVWTPFNESWGIGKVRENRAQQHFTEGIYHLTKSFDGMRPVIVNDGWEHTVSDILTLHDYEADGDVFYDRYVGHLEDITTCRLLPNQDRAALARGYKYRGQPIIISEYGGIAFSGGGEGTWGYGDTVSTEEEFLERFDKITTAIKKIPYIVGYCYTQVTDVQQEVNGLMKSNRDYKVSPDKIREINLRQSGAHWNETPYSNEMPE